MGRRWTRNYNNHLAKWMVSVSKLVSRYSHKGITHTAQTRIERKRLLGRRYGPMATAFNAIQSRVNWEGPNWPHLLQWRQTRRWASRTFNLTHAQPNDASTFFDLINIQAELLLSIAHPARSSNNYCFPFPHPFKLFHASRATFHPQPPPHPTPLLTLVTTQHPLLLQKRHHYCRV